MTTTPTTPTIPSPVGGLQPPMSTAGPPASLPPAGLAPDPLGAATAILEKLGSSGLRKSSFIALALMLLQTFLGGFLAQHGITSGNLSSGLGYAYDAGTAVYIVASKWHDVQAGKIAAVIHQANTAVQQAR